MNDTEKMLLELMQHEQRRQGTTIEHMRQDVSQFPTTLRTLLAEHRDLCSAYQHFDDMQSRQSEITGVINVHEERMRAMSNKKSVPPRTSMTWLTPTMVRNIILGIVLALGGLGAGKGIFGSEPVAASQSKSVATKSDK